MTTLLRGSSRRTRWLAGLLAGAVAGACVLLLIARPREAADVEREESERRFDEPDRAMEWILLAHRDENGRIPRDGLLRARAQADVMRRASRDLAARDVSSGSINDAAGISRSAWSWIGPSNIGGRVRAVVIHPSSPSTILTGGVAGGIWKSTNGGTTWRVIDDFLANLAVSTMVYRPSEPNRLYVGTGEGFFNADSIRGAGVFVSTDTGESWSQLGSTANVDFDFVNRLAFSADGNTLLAATRTGLFRSTDLGGSWAKVLDQPNMLDVKFIAGSSGQVVAAGRNRNAYSSNNGGVTWVASASLPVGATARLELAVSQSSPNIVYGSLEVANGEIWKSTDFGSTYTRVSGPAHLSTQGWYDNAIWVDPTNPDLLLAGGVSLFRSTNGGVSFSSIPNCHADQHIVIHDPGYNGTTNRRVYVGSDGGVCKMEDVTVNSFTSLRNGLGITQFYGAGGNVGAGRVMGGTQDNGTLIYTLSAGTTAWSSQFGADGGFSAIDPTDSNILYGETQNFRIHRSLTGGTPSQYIYGGSGSTSCSKPVPYQLTDACNGTANFIAPFILDPNEPNRLLAGGASLWRSNDPRTPNTATTGPSWAAIKPTTTPVSNISAIAVALGNSDIVWVGHNNGEIHVTLNGTTPAPTWTRTDGNLPNRVITSIAIDSTDPRIVYVAFGGFSPDGVWRTTNGGGTWVDVTGSFGSGLPDVPVRSIVLHPFVSSWLYAATDVGVFASENGGETWALPHDGPANVAVFQLFWMDTTLVAVTHGRGMFTVPTASPLPAFARRPLSQGVPPGYAVTFNVVAVGTGPFTFQWYRGQRGDTSSPIPGATAASFTTPPVTQETSFWVRLTNAFGVTDSNTATLTVLPWGTLSSGVISQGKDAGNINASPRTSSVAPSSAPASAVVPSTPAAPARGQAFVGFAPTMSGAPPATPIASSPAAPRSGSRFLVSGPAVDALPAPVVLERLEQAVRSVMGATPAASPPYVEIIAGAQRREAVRTTTSLALPTADTATLPFVLRLVPIERAAEPSPDNARSPRPRVGPPPSASDPTAITMAPPAAILLVEPAATPTRRGLWPMLILVSISLFVWSRFRSRRLSRIAKSR